MTVQKKAITSEDFELPPHLVEELDRTNAEVGSGNGQQPETDAMAEYRIEVLGKAAHVVSQDRNIAYGPPEDSFTTIAAMWNAYLGGESLLPTDVAAMLALLKIARLATNPISEDSWVDLAGYAACGASAAKTLVESTDG